MEEVIWCWSLQNPVDVIFIFRGLHEKEIKINLKDDLTIFNLKDEEKELIEKLLIIEHSIYMVNLNK